MKSQNKKQRGKERWVQTVTSVLTFPPSKIFTKDAASIARSLGSKKVSPKGIGSGIRMIQYFINRGGRDSPRQEKKSWRRQKEFFKPNFTIENKPEPFDGRG